MIKKRLITMLLLVALVLSLVPSVSAIDVGLPVQVNSFCQRLTGYWADLESMTADYYTCLYVDGADWTPAGVPGEWGRTGHIKRVVRTGIDTYRLHRAYEAEYWYDTWMPASNDTLTVRLSGNTMEYVDEGVTWTYISDSWEGLLQDMAWRQDYMELIQTADANYAGGCYCIYDMNDDGIPELFLKAGDYESYYEFCVYTWEPGDGEPLLMGVIGGAHGGICGLGGSGTFLAQYGFMGQETIYQYTAEGYRLEGKLLHLGSTHDYHPLTRLTEYDLDDLSGLTWMENEPENNQAVLDALQANPFWDVDPSAFYYKAVVWAYNNNITKGITADTFGPEESCTRGQVVTFLWRVAGCPKVGGSSPFGDVKAGTYCYDAVLWAAKNGITAGITPTSFRPDQTVTREQFVTFLYRYAGKPAVSGSAPFSDVQRGSFYEKAVIWANDADITNGMGGGKFGVGRPCTRGQTVTFLYRFVH